jgi:PAS domain S-box-containing protein
MDRVEASLSEEGRSRLLIDAITDYAIYMLSPEGIITSWNAGAERLKGYSQNEVLGQHFSLFYTDEDRASGLPARALRSAMESGRFELEGWRVRKDGTRFWANAIIDAIRSPDGRLIGFAKVTRDLTERVRAQEQLERTREQLFQAQKLEAIGQLTGGIAHDFNNLLTAILGSLELARKRLPPDPQLERLITNAVEGAERGAALTGRLLSYARRQELKVEPTDLSRLVGNMTELLQRSIGPDVTIRTDFPQALPAAMTDAVQLETALLNLAVNARDAMPEGGTLTISGTEQTIETEGGRLGPGRYVGLVVADTGVGMDDETLAKAIEPFFTTKGVGKGTGLGLSMVHGLAEQSGGKLVVDSAPGHGTSATIWLPVAQAEAVPATPEPEIQLPEPPQRPLVVLAVDDDALVLMNTQAMLEDMGHEVIDAMSGAEALKKLEQQRVDLVITDQSMPQMSGSELARRIGERWPEIAIILATGYAEVPAGSGPELPRLAKPFSQADLARVIGMHAGKVTQSA